VDSEELVPSWKSFQSGIQNEGNVVYLLTIVSFAVGTLAAIGGWVLAFVSISRENAKSELTA
jgi:hypothetical protein